MGEAKCGTGRRWEVVGQRPQTNAEKQARWRLRHDRRASAPGTYGAHREWNWVTPEIIVNLVPRKSVPIEELVGSSDKAMALYDKMVGRVDKWLDNLDDRKMSRGDLFKAFALLAPMLESLVVIRGKLEEQRASEAIDVTAQMKADLEAGLDREKPQIAETLRLMRDRFKEIRASVQ